MSAEDIFASVFGGEGGDFFSSFFGGGGGRSRNAATRGDDLATLRLHGRITPILRRWILGKY